MSQQLAVFQKPGDLMSFLEKGKKGIEMALPKHLNPDRMLRLAVTAFSQNPQLRQCTGQSILGSIIVASQLGLEPGIAGQGYLIPYKDTCTFVPGWSGLVGLLNNTGRATAWTNCVYEGDHFVFQLGSSPKLEHVPGENYGDPDKITWVYACGQVNGSQLPVIEAWPIKRVWKHRDRFNKVGQRHYSFQHPEMYARKVVLLQVLKYMPRSIELTNAITAADASERGAFTQVEGGVVIEVQNEPEETPQGRIGNGSAVEEAAEQPKGREYTVEKTAPKQQPKPAAKPQKVVDAGEDHAFTPREEKQEEPAYVPPEEREEPAQEEQKPAPKRSAGPSLQELQSDVTKRLAGMNVGKLRAVQAMVEIGLLDEVVPFGNVPQETLQALVDGWDEYKDRIPPQ